MPKFTYTGESQEGEKVVKTVEAKDRYAVYDIARKEGNTVSGISSSTGFDIKKLINIKKLEYYMSRVKDDELVMLTRNLGSMINAGLPLSRALSVI